MDKTPKRGSKSTRQAWIAPTPWEVDDRNGSELIRVISQEKENGKREIVCVFPMMADAKMKRAHAELIVKAVNAFLK